jgi:cytochrome c5
MPNRPTLMLCALAALFLGAARWPVDGAAQAGELARSTLDGVYTTAQSERGAKLAVESCDVCHAPKFTGTDLGPPVHAAEFQASWAGKPLSELFDRIFTTMPAHDPSTLGLTQTADLVAYLLDVNGYPRGAEDLPGDMAVLQQIRIAARK